jgi:quinol-cytochrome oxidoreductase complex cytochrome b subunit
VGATQQPQPAGTGATAADAAAELAEIQRRQEQVIKAVLVPVWYWWVIAAAIVAIGAARDSGDPVVQAIVIPLAVLVIVVLIVATIPTLRRVQVNSATQPDGRVAIAIIGMIVLVDGVTISLAISLAAAHVPYPVTIGCAAGAAVLVITGTLVSRYLHRLMLRQARQQMNDASQAGGSTS